MRKAKLQAEQLERIDFAIRNGLNANEWKFIGLLSGGLTGIPVLKIAVENKEYVIKLEDVNDKNFDLTRNYKIIEQVSQQGISPLVYFTDASKGIILMKYIEQSPRPQASPLWVKKFAGLIRALHDSNAFSKWKSVTEVLDYFYQKLPAEYTKHSLIRNCMDEVSKTKVSLFDDKDIRACHCDLNPANVLFDGNEYFLVDWQAASPQSFYFDLACCANWFYFYNDELCDLFLTSYFAREATKEEKSKFHLMRIFADIYYGIGFISLPLRIESDFPILSDLEIEKLPTYISFMKSLGANQVNLGDLNTQQEFGFILLKNALQKLA